MFTRWLKALTLVLALMFTATLPAQAQGKGHGGRGHGKVRMEDHHVTFSPSRRVRRGRNITPGVPRRSVNDGSRSVLRNIIDTDTMRGRGRGRGRGKN